MHDSNLEAKIKAANETIKLIEAGMIVGLGSGSTAKIAIDLLAKRIEQESLEIQCVATSIETQKHAEKLGLNLLSEFTSIDFTFDGADKVDPKNNLIKGYGGALVREKLVAKASKMEVIMVDSSKLADSFENIPIPVEVIPYGLPNTIEALVDLGAEPVLRQKNDQVFVSDNHNYILDCSFETIPDLKKLETDLKLITGVVESGLFLGLADKVIVG